MQSAVREVPAQNLLCGSGSEQGGAEFLPCCAVSTQPVQQLSGRNLLAYATASHAL